MANPLEHLPPNVVEALRRGDKIGAIKLLREVASLGLAEAKNAIDAAHKQPAGHAPAGRTPPSHADAHPQTPQQAPHTSPLYAPGLSPGEVPKTSGGMGFVLVLIVAAIMIVLFWKLA
jgi:hypothetical protein